MRMTWAALVSVTLMVPTAIASEAQWTGLAPSGAVKPLGSADRAPAPFRLDPSSSGLDVPLAASQGADGMPRPRRAASLETGAVDESALRFYASRNDTARVAAEISRLRALYPNWQPPTDLYDTAQSPAQEQHLWDLFGEGRLDEVRVEVERLRAENPEWRPSEELARKFAIAEARRALIGASDNGNWSSVLAAARAQPTLLVCTEMDVLWRVAEALAKTSDAERAFDLYRYIVANCTGAAERLATVQKASLLLAPSATEKLMALGTRTADGTGEFDGVKLDLLRRQLGDYASGTRADPADAARLKDLEELARQRHDATDAELLGWYGYARKDWAAAGEWFKNALAWKGSPKAAEGYALALRQQGRFEEAEKVAYEGRSEPLLAKLYIEILAAQLTEPKPRPMAPERLARLAAVVDETRSAVGASALGWYSYNTAAFPPAASWFAKAVGWEESEEAVLGLALAENRLGDRAAFRNILSTYGSRYATVAALKAYGAGSGSKVGRVAGARRGAGDKLARQAVELYQKGQYKEALSALDRLGDRDYGLALLRGWTLYHLGESGKARDVFVALDRRRSTKESQYGVHYSEQNFLPRQFRDEP